MDRHPLRQQFVRRINETCQWVLWCAMGLFLWQAHAETVYYTLENVILQGNNQMTGVFSWTYDIDDFENGTGAFLDLNIPWTAHDETDLEVSVDTGGSIEITFPGNLHDDGVDIKLALQTALTPTSSASLDLDLSKYEIGGNGFHDGVFRSGQITLTPLRLSISSNAAGFVTLSWEPADSSCVLQQSPTLSPTDWTNAASGNPLTVPTTAPNMFYQLVTP